jgi:ABC-type dipeptide/oligopeptide/nickel transport system permease component/ABC-type dipeptide/oligopeptide/nickel transport system permease subunit
VLIKNLAWAALALLVLLTVFFFYIRLAVGELSDVYVRDSRLSTAAQEELRRALDLERPSPAGEYLAFLRNVIIGRWGLSFSQYPRSVREVLRERLPRSLLLFGTASLFALFAGTAWRRRFDHPRRGSLHRSVALGMATIFSPLLAFALLHLFAYRLRWLPTGRLLDPALWRQHPDADVNGIFGFVALIALIALSLAFLGGRGLYGLLLRRGVRWAPTAGALFGTLLFGLAEVGLLHLRGGALAALGGDLIAHLILPWAALASVLTALSAVALPRLSGDGRAFLPALSFLLGLSISTLATIEALFDWPGLGRMAISAFFLRDLPVLFGSFLAWAAVAFALVGVGRTVWESRRRLLPQSMPPSARPTAMNPVTWAGSQRLLKPALSVVLVIVGLAVAHPLLVSSVWDPAVYDPIVGVDLGRSHPAPPSAAHPLGTDAWGRDVLSQLLYGAQSVLLLGGLAGLIAAGTGLGWAALVSTLERSRRPGPEWAARGIAALLNGTLVLPPLLLLLILPARVRGGLTVLPIWIGLLAGPAVFALLRSRRDLFRRRDGRRLARLTAAGFFGALALRLWLQSLLGYFGFSGPEMEWSTMLSGTRVAIGDLLAQDLLRYGWLLWPPALAISLASSAFALLSWALMSPAPAATATGRSSGGLSDSRALSAPPTAESPRSGPVPRSAG